MRITRTHTIIPHTPHIPHIPYIHTLQVLMTGLGIPISLGVVYIAICRIAGDAFPGVAVHAAGRRQRLLSLSLV